MLDLCYTDPDQHLRTGGYNLDDTDDLYDLSGLSDCVNRHQHAPTLRFVAETNPVSKVTIITAVIDVPVTLHATNRSDPHVMA